MLLVVLVMLVAPVLAQSVRAFVDNMPGYVDSAAVARRPIRAGPGCSKILARKLPTPDKSIGDW